MIMKKQQVVIYRAIVLNSLFVIYQPRANFGINKANGQRCHLCLGYTHLHTVRLERQSRV